MSTVAEERRLTPEDLLELPDNARFELVDGELSRKEMSLFAAWVASQLHARLTAIVQQNQSGVVLGAEASYRCYADDPDRVRRPDISFIAAARLRPEYNRGHIPVPPDLAVEVVSPTDRYIDVRQKVLEYVRAGVRLVWVLNPELQELETFRADGTYARVTRHEMLDGEDILPDFRCPLEEICRPPPTVLKR